MDELKPNCHQNRIFSFKEGKKPVSSTSLPFSKMLNPIQQIKVSELIKNLNLFLGKHGDRDVAISVLKVSESSMSAAGSTYPFNQINFETERVEVVRDGSMGDKPVCEIAVYLFPKGESVLKRE